MGNLEPILEANWRELKNGIEAKRLERAKSLTSEFVGMDRRGFIKFRTHSQTTKGLNYIQTVKLVDVKDISHFEHYKLKDVIRLMMAGDIAVHCTCKDFRYSGYKYMAWQMGYGVKSENRFPKIRNPNLEGTVCKHLYSALSVYMLNFSSIYKKAKKNSYWIRQSKINDLGIPVTKRK